MLRYVATRALSLGLSLVVASVVIFALIEVIPGDPASSLLLQKIDGRLPHPINVPIIINQNQLTGIRTWIAEGAKNN